MALDRLHIQDFRCLRRVTIDPHPQLNLIHGPNASGKTSLLEAIFCLGRGRSFRTSVSGTLVRDGARRFEVGGHVVGAPVGRVVVKGQSGRVDARIGDNAAGSLAELTQMVPVQAIDPEVHKLVEAGPERRRRFLDWGTFHVEPRFLTDWRRYRKALRQRNASLRAGAADQSIWNRELAEAGERVAAARDTYIDTLRPEIRRVCTELLGLEVDISHQAGWDRRVTLAEALETGIERDLRASTTGVGPHRADLLIRAEAHRARQRVSRGQQKLLASGLIIAQLRLFESRYKPILLLDDPAAELDADSLGRFIAAVQQLDVQLFLAALEPDAVPFDGDRQRFPTRAWSGGD